MLTQLNDRHFCVILFILSILLYWNTLSGGASYVWDDRAAILSNRDVSGVDPLINVFYHDFWGQDIKLADSHKSYRPITVLTFRFNHWLHGYSAVGFHVLNILIYAVGVVVYYNWARQWATLSVSRFAALFYCCHPVHVEAVASLVGRADSLCGLFYLIAIYLYTNSSRRLSELKEEKIKEEKTNTRISTVAYFTASFSAALCACFSKEIGITIFPIFICLEVLEVLAVTKRKTMISDDREKLLNRDEGNEKERASAFKLCVIRLSRTLFNLSFDYSSVIRVLASVCFLFVLLLHRVKMNNGTLYKWTILENHISILPHLKERVLSYSQTHFWYIFKLIYPKYLCFDYGYSCLPLVHILLDARNILPLLTYLSFISLLLYSLISMRFDVLVSLILILLPLLPALNIFFPVGTVLAERLLFLPSAGYCLLLAEILIGDLNISKLLSELLMPSIMSTKSSVHTSFIDQCQSRVKAIESEIDQTKINTSESGSEKDNKKKKTKLFDHNGNKIKSVMSNKSLKAASKQQQLETIQKNSENSEKSRQKITHFLVFLECLTYISSYIPVVFSIIVCVLFSVRVVTRNNDWNSEIRLYKSALYVCPLSVKALTNYGTLALGKGDIAGAIMVGEIATSVLYGQKAAHLNLGLAYQRSGDLVRSVRSFETALSMFPDDSKTHGCLGSALLAWSYIQLDHSLSVSLRRRAAAHMDVALNNGYLAPSVLHSRGSMAMDSKDYELALKLLLKALQVNDENKLFPLGADTLNESNTLNQLGNVYLHLERLEEAVEVFEKGVEIAPYNMALRANIGGLYRSLNRGDMARRAMEGGLDLCEWGEDGVAYRLLTGRNTGNTKDSRANGKESTEGDTTIEGIIGGRGEGSVGNSGITDPKSLKPPPAALLNNLGLVELEEGNFKVALFLFERAASIEESIEAGEMKSSDGNSVAEIMRNNIRRAAEGLRNSQEL